LSAKFENTIPAEVHTDKIGLNEAMSAVELKKKAKQLHAMLQLRISDISYADCLDYYAQLAGAKNWREFEIKYSIDHGQRKDSIEEKESLDKRRPLTSREMERDISYLKQHGHRLLFLWYFLVSTGLSPSEAFDCQVKDINWGSHSLTFRRQKKHDRYILISLPLHEAPSENLQQYVKFNNLQAEDYLFDSSKKQLSRKKQQRHEWNP